MAEKSKKVKKVDNVIVYGTGKAKFLQKDKAYKVHRELGKKLVAKGSAVTTAPTSGKAKDEKTDK